jgi:hypothetical protein
MICSIQMRKPYPPTTPTATTGQMPNASTRKVMISTRRCDRRVSFGIGRLDGLDIAFPPQGAVASPTYHARREAGSLLVQLARVKEMNLFSQLFPLLEFYSSIAINRRRKS